MRSERQSGAYLTFKQIKKGRVSDSVLEQIKKSIIDGVYSPGDKLPSEKELMDIFSVSRGSVREALRNLEESGFIVVKPGALGGAYVRSEGIKSFASKLYDIMLMERISFKEILQLRLLIEPAMARLAAQNRTQENIQEINEANAQREKAIRASKIPIVVNIDFHQAVAKATKNRMVSLLMDAIALLLHNEFKRISLSLEDHKAILNAHKVIAQHIKKKDANKAEQAMREHTLDVTKRLKT